MARVYIPFGATVTVIAIFLRGLFWASLDFLQYPPDRKKMK